jgi:guanylate kinase
VLSGPSGVGKGSVIAAVRRRHPQVWLSVSVTTRPPRPGETDGVEYHFVDDAEFARMVEAGELLEHASYAGSSYGTPKAPVEEKLASGVPALLEIELQGARLVRAAMPDARLVFLAPPSFDDLALRLGKRGTEDPERIRQRLDVARIEMAAEDEFDYIVVNDDIEAAADRLVALMEIT